MDISLLGGLVVSWWVPLRFVYPNKQPGTQESKQLDWIVWMRFGSIVLYRLDIDWIWTTFVTSRCSLMMSLLICHQHLSAARLKLGIERCRTSDQKRTRGNLWVVRISWHWNAYIDLLPQEVPATMSQILYINMWQHATKRSIMNHTISHVGPLHYIITTINHMISHVIPPGDGRECGCRLSQLATAVAKALHEGARLGHLISGLVSFEMIELGYQHYQLWCIYIYIYKMM